MADVSHELGALRFVVDSPLSSKVAMFNTHAQKHQQSQLLNPFSGSHERSVSPKPQIPRDQYGKPLAGSMTEMRGQKANMHVLREMLELCQIINSEGYDVKDEPGMRVIPFGELFNIYNYISDKVVGILLRARKHKYVEFEGEMLFQRRDDDVPVFLLRPIKEIRSDIEGKIESIKRAASPNAPQSTSVLMDKSAHQKKLENAGLVVPKSSSGSRAASKSRTPSPNTNTTEAAASPAPAPAPVEVAAAPVDEPKAEAATDATGGLESAVAAESPAQAPEILVQDENDEAVLAAEQAVAASDAAAAPAPAVEAQESPIEADVATEANQPPVEITAAPEIEQATAGQDIAAEDAPIVAEQPAEITNDITEEIDNNGDADIEQQQQSAVPSNADSNVVVEGESPSNDDVTAASADNESAAATTAEIPTPTPTIATTNTNTVDEIVPTTIAAAATS